MIYPPNTRHWQPGDLVLHDGDEKVAGMLMVVKGYDRKTGMCRTKYVHPGYYECMRKAAMLNELKFLHDPALFGVQVEKSEVS